MTKFLCVFLGAMTIATAQTFEPLKVSPSSELPRLLKHVDRDGDQRITVNDHKRGAPLVFELKTTDGKSRHLQGVYHLSNLLQELKLAEEGKREELNPRHVYENPVERISRSIRDRYWDSLTRRIDKEHLAEVLGDDKIKGGGHRYLYVPYHDLEALEYFLTASAEKPELRLKVVRLPEKVTGEYVNLLREKHGLLSLALQRDKEGRIEGVPYVVPGGRFNEMYGWDSYFEALGLLSDGRVDLARAMVDNFVYQITHYGKILNANRTYYLTRSQPPFLPAMVRAVLKRLPRDEETRAWLTRALRAAIKEYHTVWMGEERLTATGLSRYAGFAPGIPPEVEEGHFNHILVPSARKLGLSVAQLRKRFNEGKVDDPELARFFLNDRAVRESGHDTTYRWRSGDKDVCADFVTVDLNSLLYRFELDLAHLIEREFGGTFENLKASSFREFARRRKARIFELLWDPQKRMFFDYNIVTGKRSEYVSATSLWPLWAHDPDLPETKLMKPEEAKELVKNALAALEAPGGLAATAEASLMAHGLRGHARQWDWPNGWAPHQMMAWEGLSNYGFRKEAERLTYKWLYMITRNAVDYNGTIPEKYDVVARSHAVFAEYGNVGTEFSYITREGFGWMNASYQVGLERLSPNSLSMLENLIPPEWIGF